MVVEPRGELVIGKGGRKGFGWVMLLRWSLVVVTVVVVAEVKV